VLLAIYNYVLPNAIGVVHPDAPSEIVSIVCQGIWPTPNLENSALKKRKKNAVVSMLMLMRMHMPMPMQMLEREDNKRKEEKE
jgi:hypothetical protein